MVSVEEMSVELKAMWEDVNDGFVLPTEFYVHWLWIRYDKKVSFKDCLTSYKMCL